MDSRRIRPGYCFVALRGYKENGLNYLGSAIVNGASVIVFESEPDETLPEMPLTLSWVLVKDARIVLSQMAAAFYNYIADSIYNVGITGTNGKTTIMSLIHAIYSQESETAKIGTLGMYYDGLVEKTTLTTPEALDIFAFLSRAHQKGCQNLVMEVSSVSLVLHRVHNIHFSQGIFTTFSGDHLDFHQNMEDYLDAKMALFRGLGQDDWAIINADDPVAPTILEQLDSKYLTYGFSENADVRPLKYKLSLEGIQATIKTPKGNLDIKSHLIGRVNLSNILAAISSAVIKGISFEHIRAGLAAFKPVKGRLDVMYHQEFSVMVDYAHTDNALETMLSSLKEIVPNRIILVFGAGGSRDKTKRPRMGKAAAEHADFLVVTSDNPRAENPEDIIKDITAGFPPQFNHYIVETDRKLAIEKALQMAQPGDLIVMAGKGHEDYQIFKDKTIHFDDYEVANEILKAVENNKHA